MRLRAAILICGTVALALAFAWAQEQAGPSLRGKVIGVDVSGTIVQTGEGVEGFGAGDRVFAMADQTYAELCVVKAANVAKIPAGIDLIEAAALPLVTTTGNELLTTGAGIQKGQSGTDCRADDDGWKARQAESQTGRQRQGGAGRQRHRRQDVDGGEDDMPHQPLRLDPGAEILDPAAQWQQGP